MNGWKQIPVQQPQQKRSGRIWVILAFAGFALASVVAVNWNSLTASFGAAAKIMGEMHTVRNNIMKKYEAEQVLVQHSVSVGFEGAVLKIQVLNLSGEKNTDFQSMNHRAKDIARIAYESLEKKGEYKRYDVTVIQRSGFGITMSKSNSFSFRSSQLSGDGPTQ